MPTYQFIQECKTRSVISVEADSLEEAKLKFENDLDTVLETDDIISARLTEILQPAQKVV